MKLWDLEKLESSDINCVQEFKGHMDAITSVIQLKNGIYLSASMDATLRTWDPKSGQILDIFKGHTKGILCCAENSDLSIVSGIKLFFFLIYSLFALWVLNCLDVCFLILVILSKNRYFKKIT
jgi:WD40 repeat protein